jgi:hypothetical protein
VSVPWFVEAPDPKLDRRCFIVRDGNGAGARLRLFRCGGQAAFDETRRIAANIAELPGLLRRKDGPAYCRGLPVRSRSTRALDEPAFNPPGSFLWFYGTATNDPEHAHRLTACWNAFLQAETTEIERIDDGLSDMNDVLLAGGGWHVLQHQQALP